MWSLLYPIPLVLVRLVWFILFFLPAYWSRVWVRRNVPNSVISFVLTGVKQPKEKHTLKQRLATVLYLALTDSDYSDAGGEWFKHEVCNGDNGVKNRGNFFEIGMKSEEGIDPFRRFICSLRWGFRNFAWNFKEYFQKLPNQTVETEYLYQSRPDITGATFKHKEGQVDYNRSEFGTVYYRYQANNDKWYYMFDSANYYPKLKFGYYFTIGWLDGSQKRYEIMIRPYLNMKG